MERALLATSAYNVTVDNANTGNLISPPTGATPSIKFVNSIFANVSTVGMSVGSINGGTNGFYNVTSQNQFGTAGAPSRIVLASSPFQTRGAANYYLLDSSPLLRGKGVTLLSTLTAQIINKTTYAPTDYSGGFAVSPWTIVATRDAAGKDLGYHYDPIDYLVNNVQVGANAQLSLGNNTSLGVAVATYGSSGLILKENARLISEGTPYLHNHLLRYAAVQEQPVRLLGADPTSYHSIDASPTQNLNPVPPDPAINCRFTDFEGMASGGYHIYANTAAGTTFSAITLRDCSFNSASALFGGPDAAMFALNNNSFESAMIEFRYTPEIVCYNNLFRRGGLTIAKTTSTKNTWVFRDNVFDTTTITASGDPLVHGNNGYFTSDATVPVTRLTPTQSSDVAPTSFSYASASTFGSFYQPTTTVFKDVGSRAPELAGLMHHTVFTAQTQESTSSPYLIDIGFHYVSTSPYDSDNDGSFPDYKEGPVITAPSSVTYWEGQFITPFLNVNSALNAQITDPHPPVAPLSYNGAILKVYMAEGGQSGEDQFYLYLAANDPAFTGEGNYAAFSTSPADGAGDNLWLNGVIVGKIIRTPQPKGVYELCASGTTPLQVTFNGNASVATLDAVVKNVVYHNTSIDPHTTTRVISILAKDGTGSASEWSLPSHTRVDIISLNSGPAAYPFTVYTTPGVPVTFALQGSDLETRPASSLTYTALPPSIGTLIQSGPTGQSVTYTPPQTSATMSAVTTATFQYHVTDGNGASSTDATVTIVMGPGGAPAVSAGPDQTVLVGNGVYLGGLPQAPPTGMGLTWEKLSGPFPISFWDPNSSDPINPSAAVNIGAVIASGFYRPGEYLLQLKETSGSTIVASDTVNITAIQNKAPIVDAGPDRVLVNANTITIVGTAKEDWQWPVAFQWYLLTGPSGYSVQPPAGASLGLVNLPLGTYVFRLAGVDHFGAVGTDEVTIRVTDSIGSRSRTWTRDVDFEQGFLGDVTYDEIPDALTISTERRTLPFIDFAYAAVGHEDTPAVIRLDIDSGRTVGRYWAGAVGGSSLFPPPFRGVADPSGDTWITAYQPETGKMYGVRLGVVVGGVRGNRTGSPGAWGFQDDPSGEYLRPPYKCNTCIDRDNDGYLHVSGNANQSFAWPLQATRAATLAAAQDETIKDFVWFDLGWGTNPQRMFLDNQLNLWVLGGRLNSAQLSWDLQKYVGNGVLGTPINMSYLSRAISDRQGRLWADDGQNWLNFNLSTGTSAPGLSSCPDPSSILGQDVARDPVTDAIWYLCSDQPRKVLKFAYNGTTYTTANYSLDPAQTEDIASTKYLTVDADGNVWVVTTDSQTPAKDHLDHLRTDGTWLGRVDTGCLSTIDCMGVDWKGRLWLAGKVQASDNSSTVVRINPSVGVTIIVNNTPYTIGKVDLTRVLGNTAANEQVSVNTIVGSEPASIAPLTAVWRVVHDGGQSDFSWGRIKWTSSEDTALQKTLSVRVRTANKEVDLAGKAWSNALANDVAFSAAGQFIEIQVTFNKGTDGSRPILYDLSVAPGTSAPVIDEHRQHIVVNDSVSIAKNSRPVTIDVLANDSPSLTLTSVSSARHGSVSIAAGKLQYSAPAGFYGVDRFVYQARTSDLNQTATDYGLVTVNVSPVETPPTAHHLDGTLVNAPTWVPPDPNTGTSGWLEFPGSGNRQVKVANSPLLDLGTDFTIAFSYNKLADIAAAARIIGKGTKQETESWGIWDTSGSGHQLRFQFRNTDGNTVSILSDRSLLLGWWTDVAITFSGGYATFYIDGNGETPKPITGTPVSSSSALTSSGALTMGYAADTGEPAFGGTFNGRLDEVRIFSRALSAAEISDLRSGPGPRVSSVSALVARWSMDEGSGFTAFDMSSDNPVPDTFGGSTYDQWIEHFGAFSPFQPAECKPPVPAGHAPVAAPDFVTRAIRLSPLDTVPTKISVLANDTDSDLDAIYLVDDFPRATTFGHVQKQGNDLYYLPSLQSYGIDRFQYTIRDKTGLEANGTVKVFVAPVNPPTLIFIQNDQVSAAAVTAPITITEATGVDPNTGLGADTQLSLYAKVVLGSIDMSMFNNDFFFGLATGQFYSSTTPNKPQVVRVEFYDGNRKIGESRSPVAIEAITSSYVYRFDWHRITAGTHYVTAVATDSIGSRVVSQFSPEVSQTVVVQVNYPASANGNHPPVAQISHFATTDLVAPPQPPVNSPVRPDNAANSTRPVIVKNALPTLTISTSDDNIGIDTHLYYRLLLYRPDNTFIGNITPGIDLNTGSGYGTVARTSALTDSLLSLDFTGLADGAYQLELVVTDGYDETRTPTRYTFALRSALKLGQLKFEEEDYMVTTAGMPLTISRAYDSFNPLDGDFGVGWTFSIADLNVEFDEERTDAAAVDTDETFSLRTGGGRDVTLTLPDGRRTTFVFTMHSADENGYGWLGDMPFSFQADWISEPGVTAKLTTLGHVDQDFGDDIAFGFPGSPNGLNYWKAGGPACPAENYDIPALKLTLQDGTQYTIERDQGASDYVATDVGDGKYAQLMPYGKARVTRIDKPNGDSLVIGPGGIDHYIGAADHSNSQLAGTLYFERDQAGRIVAIHDQLNATQSIPALVTYEYDGLGNLATVNKLTKYDATPKQDYVTSTYEYTNPDFPHYLTKAVDGRGIPIMLNTYENGKLKYITAPDGRRTAMDYPTSGFVSLNHPAIAPLPAAPPVRAQTITEQFPDSQSPSGYRDLSSTRLEIDGVGNVILSVDALGACTERWFDEFKLLRRQTIKPTYAASGETTDIVYERDSLGRVTAVTTEFPYGSGIKSRDEYNIRGQMVCAADFNHYTSGAVNTSPFYTTNWFDLDSNGNGSGNLLASGTKSTSSTGPIWLSQQVYFDASAPHFKGLLKSTIDALGNETSYTYYDYNEQNGRLGDVKEITQYQGSAAIGTKLAGSQYFYNILTGARLSEIKGDYSGTGGSFAPIATTVTAYDSRNRPISLTNPIGDVSSTTYNAAALVASTADPYGATTRYGYDGLGVRTQTEYPDGSVARSVTYYGPETGHNNWLRHVVQENRHFPADAASGTRVIYDEAGRAIQTQVLKDLVIAVALNGEVCTTTFTGATTVSFNETQYDFTGRITMSSTPRAQGAAANLAIWTKSEYDENGRRWRERRAVNPDGTIINGTTLTTVIDYDKNGNQKWTLDPTQFAAITITGADTPSNWRNQIASTYFDRITNFTYDDYNRITRTTLPLKDPVVSFTETKYDNAGRAWIAIDADRKGTGYAYDALGRLTWVVTDVDPSVTAFANSPYTLDSLETWARAGRTASDSTATRYQYDALGNLTSQTVNGTGGATYVTTFSYNAIGQRTRRKLPASTDATAEHIINEIVYSTIERAHRQIHVDFNGAAIVTDFDLSGRVIQRMPAYSVAVVGGEAPLTYATGTINPAGANNAIKFSSGTPGSDPNGLPVVLLADNAHVSGSPVISYDSVSDVVLIRYNTTTTASALITAVNAINSFKVTAALDTVADSGNNGSGQLGAPTGDATAVTFTYDGGGRRMQMIDNYGTGAARTTKYAYDESGRLKVKQSPQGTLTYTYNPDGNVSEITARHGYNFTGSQQSLFNAANQTTMWARTTGAHLSYQYDGRGRLYQAFTATPDATHSSVLRATYGYDQAGNLTSVQYPNGVTTSYYYNARNALRYINALNSGTPIASFDYDDYDTTDNITFTTTRSLTAAGLRQGLAEMITYNGTTTRRSLAYDYDGLNRLRAERIRSQTGTLFPSFPVNGVPTTASPGDILYDFTTGYDNAGYDKSGNRRYRTVNTINMVGVVNNVPTSVPLQNLNGSSYYPNDCMNYNQFNYDKNGNNLYQATYISQQTPSQIVPSSANPDKFDLANHLIQRGGGSTYVTFIYDGDGNRVVKTSFSGGVTTTTHYLVDDINPTGFAQVLEEASTAGAAPTVSYVYGSDLISQDRSGTVKYYGYDGQGSVRYLTSGTAPITVTDTYMYDAFGILLSANGSTINNYRYVGEQWDPELGMYYLRARYYHPDIDRFWTMDSFDGAQEDPISLHKYLYSVANPINGRDPSGHETLLTCLTASSIAMGVRVGYESTVLEGGFKTYELLTRVMAGETMKEIEEDWISSLVPDCPSSSGDSLIDQLTDASIVSILPSGWKPTVGSGRAYSVAFAMKLPNSTYPGKSRKVHFKAANEELLRRMASDPEFSKIMEELIPNVKRELKGPKGGISTDPPKNWSWHHHPNEGMMQLVPNIQHTAGGNLQVLFHKGGKGGMRIWGRLPRR